ncbi:MAG: hypothetical protein PHD76_08590 [Methylacidiphilales bacterium]|nr:hypothetical protein [Candidatus Methylacidiphilales bacterium]
MKIILTIVLASLSLVTAHAEVDHIRIALKVLRDGNTMQTPSVIVLPGKASQLAVTQDYKDPGNRSLPVGIIFDSIADFKDGKIKYSCLLTLRERQKTKDEATQSVSFFKTQEFMLSGLSEAGKDVKTDLGDGLSIVLSLSKVNAKGEALK